MSCPIFGRCSCIAHMRVYVYACALMGEVVVHGCVSVCACALVGESACAWAGEPAIAGDVVRGRGTWTWYHLAISTQTRAGHLAD